MNLLAIALQHAEDEAGQSVFNLSTSVSFWTVVIFIALAVVLAKYAFPPILGYAAAREQRIQDSLDEAKRAREEAQAALEQQRAELASARQQAQQVIAEGRVAAEKVRQDLMVRARSEQEELLERARQDIARERDQAVEAVRREAVDLALAAAGRLIEQRLTAEEDRRLVIDFLGRAGDGAGAA
jgi:F-type H+-transporting ATPase subunit b